MNKLYVLAFAFLFFCSTSIEAQWSNAEFHFVTENNMPKALSLSAMDQDANGDLHMIFQQDNQGMQELWYAQRKADASFTEPTLVEGITESVYEAKLKVLDNGKVVVSYLKGAESNQQLYINTIGEADSETMISGLTQSVHTPDVEIDANGMVHYTYVTTNEDGDYRVYYGNVNHDNPVNPFIEELLYSNVDDPQKANPQIAISNNNTPHIFYAGPSGISGFKIQYAYRQNDGLWYYTSINQTPNQFDEECVVSIKDGWIHLVYSGNDGIQTNSRVVYIKKPVEGGSSTWSSNVVVADESNVKSQSIFVDNNDIVHISLLKEEDKWLYVTNSEGNWNNSALLDDYSLKQINLLIDDQGNGFILAEHLTGSGEEIVLWGNKDVEDPGTGLNDLFFADLKLYPNPASSYVNIETNQVIQSIQIFDTQSRLIFNQEVHNNQLAIDLTDWSKGIYFVKLNDGINQRTEKIIIR